MAESNVGAGEGKNVSIRRNTSTTNTGGGDEDNNNTPLITALSVVVQTAAQDGQYLSDMKEVMRAITKKDAQVCLISSTLESGYANYIHSACLEHGVKVLKVPNSKLLGSWCKTGKEEFIVITDFGPHTNELEHVLLHFQDHRVRIYDEPERTHDVDEPSLIDDSFVDELIHYIPNAVMAMTVGGTVLGGLYFYLPDLKLRLTAYLISFSIVVVLILVFFGCHFFYGRISKRRERRSD